MRRLCLVRHAPTHAKAMVGWSDLPADCSDQAGLGRLRAALPAGAALVSSDLCRAVQTADALGWEGPRLPGRAGLREIHFGLWEMQTYAQVEAADPARLRAFWENPGLVTAPGGEGWHGFSTRVNAALDELLAQTPGPLIVVCHFGPIIAAVQRAMGCEARQAFAHRIDNLSLTEIEISPGGWRLERVNHRP